MLGHEESLDVFISGITKVVSIYFQYVWAVINDIGDFEKYGIFFGSINVFQELVWGLAGILIILCLGIYFTIRSNCIQFTGFFRAIKYIFNTTGQKYSEKEISPARAFFASLGGCVGVGNLVSISIAIKIGGPGSIFWMWVIAFFGVIIKYSEIYLGVTFRQKTADGKYLGGPMYFLQKAFPKAKWVANLMAIFMCIYGVEVFMFKVIQTNFVHNYSLDANMVTAVLLVLVWLGVKDGVKSIGAINALMIPLFIVLFFALTGWVLYLNYGSLGGVFTKIISSAFTGHAAVGGFAGSSVLLTISRGISGACYSGDIAIGYESIMHSSAKISDIKRHSSLSFLNIFLDTFIVCTCTALIVIVTGVWVEGIEPAIMLQVALEKYVPYVGLIMPIFIFLLAYTTVISYFVAGLQCAQFLNKNYGKQIFFIVGSIVLVLFTFFETEQAAIVMYASGAALMLINTAGMFVLRRYIKF